MPSSQFEVRFQTALEATGEAYRTARAAVIELGDAAVPALRAKAENPDWRTRLVAQALEGWLVQPDRFEQAIRYIQGELPGMTPITGKFSTRARAETVATLGPGVTPLLLEMLLKSQDYRSAEERSALFFSLKLLGDPRAVEPLLDLLQREGDEELRRSAEATLGGLRDRRAVPPLTRILEDATESVGMRVGAASSLGELAALEAAPALRRHVADANPPELRLASVRSLGMLGDRQATPELIAALETRDSTLLETVIEVLGRIGDRSALPRLERLERHPDESVRDAAKEARDAIGAR